MVSVIREISSNRRIGRTNQLGHPRPTPPSSSVHRWSRSVPVPSALLSVGADGQQVFDDVLGSRPGATVDGPHQGADGLGSHLQVSGFVGVMRNARVTGGLRGGTAKRGWGVGRSTVLCRAVSFWSWLLAPQKGKRGNLIAT